MLARLIVVRGPDKGTVFEIPLGFSGQLGRGQDAEFRLSDATVSRLHCHVEHQPEGLMVINLSSRHTLLDGQDVSHIHVTDAQTIVVGETHLRLCLLTDEEATSTRTKDQIGSPEGFLLPNRFPTAGATATTGSHPILPRGLIAPIPPPARARRFDWRWAAAACLLPLVFGGGLMLRGGGKAKEVAVIGATPADAGPGTPAVAPTDGKGDKGFRPAVPPRNPDGEGRLFVLAVGVSKYQDSKLDLNYAAKDAELVVETIAGRAGGTGPKLFTEVKTPVILTDKLATRSNILRAVHRIAQSAVAGDFVFISMSGHGLKDGAADDFFFLPHDFTDAGPIDDTAVGWYTLMRMFRETRCRVAVLLDACHSGAASAVLLKGADDTRPDAASMQRIMDRHAAAAKKHELVLLSGCESGQKAQEDGKYGQGALTLAFCEAVRGKQIYPGGTNSPPVPSGGVVSWEQAVTYSRLRVRELTNERQTVADNKSKDVDPSAILLGR